MIYTVCATEKCQKPVRTGPCRVSSSQLSLLMLRAPFLSVRPEPPDRRLQRGHCPSGEVVPRMGRKVPVGNFAKAISKLQNNDVLGGPVESELPLQGAQVQ